MKLYLTNILVNYDVFYQEMKSIGFSDDLPNKVRNTKELQPVLEDLIDNITIFNELINIFDYSPEANYTILKRLKNIGRRKTTLIANLIELNKENLAEDESIDLEYDDTYLFESENLNQSIGGAIKHIAKSTTKGAAIGAAGGAVVGGASSALAAKKTADKNSKNYGSSISDSDKKSIRNGSMKNGAKDGAKAGAIAGGALGGATGFVKGVVDVAKGKHKPAEPKKTNQSVDELGLDSQIQYLQKLDEGIKGAIKGAVAGIAGPIGGAYYGHKAEKYKKESQKLKSENTELKLKNMSQSIDELALQSKEQYLQELNEGFGKNLGKAVKHVAKQTAKGAAGGAAAGGVAGAGIGAMDAKSGSKMKAAKEGGKAGAALGAVVGAASGLGKGLGGVLAGKHKEKKPVKKLNESMQQFIDDGSLENDYEWNFDDEMFDEDDMLFEAENLGKPKIGTKKSLGEYREVTIGKRTMLLTTNKSNSRIVILLDYAGITDLSSILDQNDISENWWIVDAFDDENDGTGESYGYKYPEVAYCLENFDEIMK